MSKHIFLHCCFPLRRVLFYLYNTTCRCANWENTFLRISLQCCIQLTVDQIEATKNKDGWCPRNFSSVVIIKADSVAGNILEITPLLWTQPSLWAKSNKKTFVRVWSSHWPHPQHSTGIFLTFNIRKVLPLKAQITRDFSQMQNLSELSSRPRHQHKAKNVAFMDKFNMQLYYNISIFTDFQLWVIQLNEKRWHTPQNL